MLDTARPAPAAASGLTRLAIPAAVLAGVLAVALGAFQLLAPAQPADGRPFVRFSDYVIEILFAASLLATLGAVLLLARYHRELGRWGTLGMIAASAYALGLGLVGISAAATAIRGVDTLGVIQFPAVGLWLVAGLLMAIAVARPGAADPDRLGVRGRASRLHGAGQLRSAGASSAVDRPRGGAGQANGGG